MGADNPRLTDEKTINDVYHDRNLFAIAFARAMRLSGEFEMAARGGWTRRD